MGENFHFFDQLFGGVFRDDISTANCMPAFTLSEFPFLSSFFPSNRKNLRYLIDTDIIAVYSPYDDSDRPVSQLQLWP